MAKLRRRGTAIIDSPKGILVTAMNRGVYLLPGGGANRKETRFLAAQRELTEETGLLAHAAKILFRFESKTQNHTVCILKAKGKAKPMHEIKSLAFYKIGSDINISNSTRIIIDKYLDMKSKDKTLEQFESDVSI